MEDRLKSLASEEQKAKAREKMAAHAQAKDSGAPALVSPPPGEERQQGCVLSSSLLVNSTLSLLTQ